MYLGWGVTVSLQQLRCLMRRAVWMEGLSLPGPVRTSASLLGLPEDPLLEALRVRTIRAGRQRQVFLKPCSRAECDTRRDCLAKLVYAR